VSPGHPVASSGRRSTSERQRLQLCIWAAAATGTGQGGLFIFATATFLRASCLRLAVACLELPERERREMRLGVEEERIRF
jgi:hypothetical protein